jgi:hypothetical protein
MAKKSVNANLDNMLCDAEDELSEVIRTTSKKIYKTADLTDWLYVHVRCQEVICRLENVRKAFADYRFSQYQSRSLKSSGADKTSEGKYYPIILSSGVTLFRDSESFYRKDRALWYCPNCMKIGLASPLKCCGDCFEVTHYSCAYCGFTVGTEEIEGECPPDAPTS